jgi:hypothetical protein
MMKGIHLLNINHCFVVLFAKIGQFGLQVLIDSLPPRDCSVLAKCVRRVESGNRRPKRAAIPTKFFKQTLTYYDHLTHKKLSGGLRRFLPLKVLSEINSSLITGDLNDRVTGRRG